MRLAAIITAPANHMMPRREARDIFMQLESKSGVTKKDCICGKIFSDSITTVYGNSKGRNIRNIQNSNTISSG